MAPLYYVHMLALSFYTASLLLGNHMDKSKGTRSIFLLLLDLTYCILFIYIYISVEIIVITNRKTSYRNNRENITIKQYYQNIAQAYLVRTILWHVYGGCHFRPFVPIFSSLLLRIYKHGHNHWCCQAVISTCQPCSVWISCTFCHSVLSCSW